MNTRAIIVVSALVAGPLGFVAGFALAPSLRQEAGEALPGSAPVAEPAARESEGEPPVPALETQRPRVIRADTLPEPYPTRIDRATLDLTGDGVPEVAEIYANVERDHRGRIMWDDGQRWMLVVHDGDGEEGYLLFDDFVQLGRLSLWAIETEEPSNALILEIAAAAGVRVWKVRFDRAQQAFVEESPVSASGNVVHRSPMDLD